MADVFIAQQIEIEDTGAGVPDELADHIFEPFISTKSGGSGLSLAMVASVIADHGGAISHLPRRRGTCFSINLPVMSSTSSGRKTRQILNEQSDSADSCC